MTLDENIQLLYITYFNRAADQQGLAYWKEQLQEGASIGVIVKFCVWPVRRQSCLTDRSRVRRP